MYTHKCGKRVKDTAYHCNGCHESFIGLTAFDAHRKGGIGCNFAVVADPYSANSSQYWADEGGYLHLGKKMTEAEKARIWGSKESDMEEPVSVS